MKTNGCHNHEPYNEHVFVQDGWQHIDRSDTDLIGGASRLPIIRCIENPMSKECQYSILTTGDNGCDGCKWRSKDES